MTSTTTTFATRVEIFAVIIILVIIILVIIILVIIILVILILIIIVTGRDDGDGIQWRIQARPIPQLDLYHVDDWTLQSWFLLLLLQEPPISIFRGNQGSMTTSVIILPSTTTTTTITIIIIIRTATTGGHPRYDRTIHHLRYRLVVIVIHQLGHGHDV